MASKTIKIEIPVEVVDNTSSGTSGVVKNLSKMEKAMQRMEKQSKQHVSKMEESMQKKERGIEKEHEVEILANDHATPVIHDIEDAAEHLGNTSAEVDVGANDHATAVIREAGDAVTQFDCETGMAEIGVDSNVAEVVYDSVDAIEMFSGMSGLAEIRVDDHATQIINAAENEITMFGGLSAEAAISVADLGTPIVDAARDLVAQFDGEYGMAEISTADAATPIIHAAMDSVEMFSGMAGYAELGAEDTASPVIDDVTDKLSEYAGKTWNATVGVVNAVTSPLGKIGSIAGNPLAQAGAVAGVSFGVADTVDTYKDFESMMSSVKAISNANESDFAALTEKAKQMGADTKFSAYESAEAFNYMAMAGWKTKDMMGGIEGIMSLAAASGEDLGSTSDIVTDALTAFGMQASESTHFADVLAQASANANTNVSMLGESFKYVAPVAGTMGYSIEDTSLALGLMANAGIKGSMSGTALKTSIANLASPTANMAAAMDKYGISLTDNEGNMKSLKGVMDNLRTSLGGLSETEQTAAASTIFGKEAMSGMLAIINAAEEDYNKLTEAVYNADGASQKMADTMMDNLAGSFELLSGAADEVKMTLGERLSPYLRGAADALAAEMPGIKQGVTEMMDFVDAKAADMKHTINEMTSSEEWANADFLGKADIAWNKVIAEPFMEWAGGDGAHLVSQGVSSLFSSAAAILPGGKQAGLASWLSAGLLAKGAVGLVNNLERLGETLSPLSGLMKGIGTAAKGATGIRSFISNLGSMTPASLKFGLGAAAVTAAVVGIAAAIDNYNQKEINKSLEDHFGKIKLGAEEIREIASDILDQKYLANVEFALNEVKNAEQFRADAQKALESNEILEFKSQVGIKLTPEEQEEYVGNIDTFIDSKIQELESETFAAHVHVQTYLGGTEEGETLADNIEKWAKADYIELDGLSQQLSAEVATAIKDGIISAPEEEVISALQEKMNGIASRWKKAEAQAQWDWIQTEYGGLSAADLESGSFADLLGEMRNQRKTAMESVRADVTSWYAELNAMEDEGRITHEQNRHYQELTGNYVRNQKGIEISKSLSLASTTLQDTYGDLINSNLQSISDNGGGLTIDRLNKAAASGDWGDVIYDQTLGHSRNFLSMKGGADRKALLGLYEEAKPDVSEMSSIIDQYIEEEQAVPQELMDSFNDFIDIGAAAGDTDAAWQKYANSIFESGSEALKDAVTNPDNPMYASLRDQMPPKLQSAIDRAFAETTNEEYTLEGLKSSVEGEVDIDKDKWISGLNEKLGDLAKTEEMTAEGATIKVESGDCLWDIGNALGVDWRTIAEENGIESPYTIHAGDELKISMDALNAEVDSDAAQSAIEQAMSALTTEGAEFSVTAEGVTVNLSDVQVDSASAASQIEAALGMEAGTLGANGITVESGATVTIPSELVQIDTSALENAAQTAADGTEPAPVETETAANVTVTEGKTDASQARAQAQSETEDAFDEPFPADSDVDLTLTHNNSASEAARIYSEVDGEVTGAFAAGYSATADVSVHLNWHLLNPSINIATSSSGSSVSASIATPHTGFIPHAEGGVFGNPHLGLVAEDGPEAIIPLGAKRRERGLDLWMQAGAMLGVSQYAEGGIIGKNKYSSDLFRNSEDSEDSRESSENKIGISVDTGGSRNVQVSVNMSPVFEISNDNPDTVMKLIRSQFKELTNDMTAEIARRVADSFANTPA